MPLRMGQELEPPRTQESKSCFYQELFKKDVKEQSPVLKRSGGETREMMSVASVRMADSLLLRLMGRP